MSRGSVLLVRQMVHVDNDTRGDTDMPTPTPPESRPTYHHDITYSLYWLIIDMCPNDSIRSLVERKIRQMDEGGYIDGAKRLYLLNTGLCITVGELTSDTE